MPNQDKAPWRALYDRDVSESLELEYTSALDMFRASATGAPDSPLIHYLDATLTVADVDRMSDALAVALLEKGFPKGGRLAVYMQNVPQYLIAMLAAWKAGGIMVSVNPMYRHREVVHILNDSGASGLVCLESLYEETVADVREERPIDLVVTTSELDFVETPDAFSVLKDSKRGSPAGTEDFLDLLNKYQGRRPGSANPTLNDIAFLTYTSGTTGPAKGAMNTHRNVVFTAQAYRDWIRLGRDDVILGIAPLFHITGLIGHMALAMLGPIPLVLGFRFEPNTMLELIQRWRATFTIGAITAFTALMNAPTVDKWDVSSMQKVYTGGQPVPAATVESFERKFGLYIRQAYGLTETTSPTHFVPLGRRSPADPASSCLSVGVPIFDTRAGVIDDQGTLLPPGEVGEIVVSGPQVVPGYWQNPDETANAFRDGWFRTGDVGLMDGEGWFYVVDRKKDQINASGYKVWPREVEDALYEHPSVREVAVVGVPDEYRGETVKAFVSFRPGMSATVEELKAHSRDRLATYKVPREIEFVDDLPKTASGKILRRELRQVPVNRS